ncbi:MAG: 3'-5' exonuclease [Bacilli bacterium]
MDFIALDFETANENRTSICQIGAVKYHNGQIVATYNVLVKPVPNYFNYQNTLVHGIDEYDVINEMTFDEVYHTSFKDFIDGYHIVAHNCSFDMYVLFDTLKYYNLPLPRISYACTLRLSRLLLKEAPSFKLNDLADHYLNYRFKHHDALADAKACALLYIYLDYHFDATSIALSHFKKAGFYQGNHISFTKR